MPLRFGWDRPPSYERHRQKGQRQRPWQSRSFLNIGVVPFIRQNLRAKGRYGRAGAPAVPDGLICEHPSARLRITYAARRMPPAMTSIVVSFDKASGTSTGIHAVTG